MSIREGWGEEGALLIHLESEAAVDPAQLYVLDLDDRILADQFSSLEEAQRYVERRSAEDGHISFW